MDSGLGLVLLRWLLYGCLATALIGGYAAVQFRGLKTAQSMELAHVARNLASGEGFSTRCVRPFDVWYLGQRETVQFSEAQPARIPELRHAPAYPTLLSWVYRMVRPRFACTRVAGMLDAEYKAVLPLGILLTLLCAAALFGFGHRLFGPRVAGMATTIYLVSNVTLKGAVSGLPLPLLSLAATLACGFAIRAIQISATGRQVPKLLLAIVGSSACAAVAVLADVTMIAVVAGVLVLLGLQLQRLRWVNLLLFVLVVAALVGPWLLQNRSRGVGLLGARPYGAVADTALFAEDALERSVAPEFNSYRVTRAIRHKIYQSVAASLSGRGMMAGGIIVCFFVVALIHRYDDPIVAGMKGFILGTVVLLLLLSPVVGPGYGVISALFPLVVLLGVTAFVDYIDREEFFDQSLPTALTWLLVAASAVPAVAQVMTGTPSSYPPYYAPIQQFAADLIVDDEHLYTDIPWATAWYGDRTSILLPSEVDDVDLISGGWDRVGGLYLTTETSDRPLREHSAWRPIFDRTIPATMPLKHAIELPTGRSDQLFLSDRPRWERESGT